VQDIALHHWLPDVTAVRKPNDDSQISHHQNRALDYRRTENGGT
jgi:hypothetical protein